jgi:hypothetical protein
MENNMNHKKAFVFLIALFAIFIIPYVAKADIVYTFIKMTCDPASKSASLNAFFDENESGKLKTQNPEKDVYPLGERTGTATNTSGNCDLDNDQTVSFIAYQYALPKHDDLKLFFNHKELDNLFTLNDQWTMEIRQTELNNYNVKFCPDRPSSLRSLDASEIRELTSQHKKKCDSIEIHNGSIVNFEAVDPSVGQ